ncbi:MAG: tetratricopeptide repeat protein [Methylotenera sp.]|nr:tetratricopeptide repeat protein [Oligoflexia bacterium]
MTKSKIHGKCSRTFLLLTLTGAVSSVLICNSGQASELTLSASEEGATIHELTGEGANQKLVPIGKTPMTIKDADSSETKLYKIEKPGFATVYIPITSRMKANTSIAVTLKKNQEWAPSDIEKRSLETAEEIVDQVYSIQSLLDSRKTAEAMAMAETLRGLHPSSFSVRLVYANALLVSGEVNKAQSLYTSLITEIPPGRASMKSSIQKIINRLSGGRSTASSNSREGTN